MIDNLFDVLYVAKTGKIKPDASLTDNLFGKKFYDAHSGIITTATGNPVSIITNKAQNAISTLLSYSPKQSGSGDPSPQNIRPIEGWTEANLTGAGKNLFDLSTLATTGITYADGVLTGTASAFNSAYSSGIPYDFSFLKNSRVSIACEAKVQTASGTSNGLRMRITYTDDTYSDFSWKNNDDSYVRKYFASAEGKSVSGISITYNSTGSNVWLIRDFQIEVGTVPTDYVPFITPTTITESLGGTYYGFEIDVERGVLRNTWGYIAEYDGEELPGRWISDRDVYSPNTSPTIGAEVAYELATPLELPLTPQTVALLEGNNTIWTDGDSLSVTYKAKKA